MYGRFVQDPDGGPGRLGNGRHRGPREGGGIPRAPKRGAALGGDLRPRLSDEWFDGLIRWAQGLDTRPCGSYVENRMAILARKGDAPCPESEDVRRALWASYLAWRRGFWRAADERTVLTMTHALTGGERIALENRCGGAAAAIYKLKGEV